MDIAVQRGVVYVDAFCSKQCYLSAIWHSEVICQTKQTGKQIRGKDSSKVFQGMLHRVSESAVCKLYPCHLVHMLHVMSMHMFYKPVFPHISHSVTLHKPCTIRELVIVFYFMNNYFIHLQPGLCCTGSSFLFP